MSVTQIDIDDDALERAMALSEARTKEETVNPAVALTISQSQQFRRFCRNGP